MSARLRALARSPDVLSVLFGRPPKRVADNRRCLCFRCADKRRHKIRAARSTDNGRDGPFAPGESTDNMSCLCSPQRRATRDLPCRAGDAPPKIRPQTTLVVCTPKRSQTPDWAVVCNWNPRDFAASVVCALKLQTTPVVCARYARPSGNHRQLREGTAPRAHLR